MWAECVVDEGSKAFEIFLKIGVLTTDSSKMKWMSPERDFLFANVFY